MIFSLLLLPLLAALSPLCAQGLTTTDTLPSGFRCIQVRDQARALFKTVKAEADFALYTRQLLQIRQEAQVCGSELRIVIDLNLCKYYHRLGKFDSASHYVQQALQLYQKDTTVLDIDQVVGLYTFYSNTLYDQQQYASSLAWELKALQLRETHQLPDLGSSYENIALIYMETKDYQKALSYFKKAETAYQDAPDYLAYLHLNLGNAYSKLHQLGKAQEYLALAMDYAQSTADEWLELDVLRVQVPMAQELKNYPLLLQQAERGIALAVLLEDSLGLLELYSERFAAHTQLQQWPQARQDRVQIEYLLRAVPSAFERSIYYESLIPYFAGLGQHDSAALYHQQFRAIEDSLKEAKLVEKIAELEARYEAEKNAQRIDFLERETEQQAQRERLYWVIGGLLLILALGLGLLYRWRTQRNRELRELNALKDQFFGIVAHDLKTPLVGFRSITEALQTHHASLPPERIHYFLGQLQKAAHQLYDLLQNLLQWATSQTGRLRYAPEQLSLRPQVESVLALLRPSASIQSVELSHSLPEDLSVWADPQLTQPILRNLLDNAVKFTPAQGRVWLEAQREGNFWKVWVCDTGPGMTAAQQALLFEGYHHTGPRVAGSGTGLGLILCRNLVQLQGGQIGVESAPGQGSRFWFTLPVSSDFQPVSS